MDKLLSYIQTYGLSILVIAVSIIAVIGLLKVCKVFDKIQSKNVKKFIYYALDIVLSFGGSAIYFACFHKDFAGYAMYCVSELTVVTTLYAVYENCGLRAFVKFLLSLTINALKKNPEDQLGKWAEKIGLEKSLEELQNKLAEKEAKEAEEKAKEQPVADETSATKVNEIKY